jgi:hypothetical protein
MFSEMVDQYVHFIIFLQVVYERQPIQPARFTKRDLKGGLQIPGTPRPPAGLPCTLIKAFGIYSFRKCSMRMLPGRGVSPHQYIQIPLLEEGLGEVGL